MPLRSFYGLLHHPVPRDSYESGLEHTSGIQGSESLQLEFFRSETGAFDECFVAARPIRVPTAGRRGKHERIVIFCGRLCSSRSTTGLDLIRPQTERINATMRMPILWHHRKSAFRLAAVW